jgi:hypothetical protein
MASSLSLTVLSLLVLLAPLVWSASPKKYEFALTFLCTPNGTVNHAVATSQALVGHLICAFRLIVFLHSLLCLAGDRCQSSELPESAYRERHLPRYAQTQCLR